MTDVEYITQNLLADCGLTVYFPRSMQQTFKFCEFEEFYAGFRPFSSYGKGKKGDLLFFTDSASLKNELDGVALFAEFVKKNQARASQLGNLLSHIPNIDGAANLFVGIADLFNVKKFLLNYRLILELLPKRCASHCGADFGSGDLLTLLQKGQGEEEAFFVSDLYSSELSALRERIVALDEEIAGLKTTAQRHIIEKYSLDFSQREFLVVSESRFSEISSAKELYVEPMDGANVIVKPVYGEYFILRSNERDHLLSGQKKLETSIIAGIGKKVSAERDRLKKYTLAVTEIDTLLAKAILAVSEKHTRPVFGKFGGRIKIKDGTLVPLKKGLDALKIEYTPLCTELKERVSLIRGSNMGGKTVVLKSVGFLQLIAQMGFFVPARSFSTVIFDRISFIGSEEGGGVKGLSSFGLEMFNFNNSIKNRSEKVLFLLDEFAKATNSDEATALLYSALRYFAGNKNCYALFSTHFSGLPKLKGVQNFRMKGLDSKRYERYFGSKGKRAAEMTLEERLKLINSFMEYELVTDDGKAKVYDALKIARMIGVDRKILTLAEKYII